ncbi:MAG: hypothetical protein KCHDKBKB_02958 [Elusimicrobia bacterium]|nr:hypothetical protein [Elusimicrobiota bacterium]
MKQIIPIDYLQRRIFMIRGQKVMIDEDLAALYGVQTKRLNEQVRRNKSRFPSDFMFQLTATESKSLRSQIATSNRGGRRYHPLAFTEQGVAMLSTVLNSERAIQTNIAIMRAFTRLREMVATHRRLAHKLRLLEERLGEHATQIHSIFEAIVELTQPRRIGFKP